eukprot:TRINITY_DN12221_c0_g2_i12.p1 TRINITY_DN12221_c0_g2~~TRINITY_DN12221_c0_g2_i12.p1  ORF type:complete len:248 (-),score=72.06 TRINITY_DN12221_c0_g2_i12:153-896(-)
MALNVRRQSILQSMQHVSQEAGLFVKILLAVCTISASLALPMCKLMNIESVYVLSAWRFSILVVQFIPLMIYELRRYGEGVRKLFSIKNIGFVVMAQVYNTLTTFCQLIAMQYTYTSHVLLFSGMVSIVLLFWKVVKRLPIATLEIAGILVAVVGSVLITQTKTQEGGYMQNSIILGDLIAFLGSVFLAFNLQIVSPLMQFYRDGIYMMQSNITGVLVSYIALYLSGDTWYFSFDKERGIFGFLHPS